MQEGLKKAVGVPLKLAQTASALFTPLLELSEIGNINCKSDLQVSINLEIKNLVPILGTHILDSWLFWLSLYETTSIVV